MKRPSKLRLPPHLVAAIGGGAGLFLLYGIISVVRQVAEPHLVGKSIGLSPVMMLIAFYAGLRLFGVPGLFIGPGLMLLFKSLWQGGAQHAS